MPPLFSKFLSNVAFLCALLFVIESVKADVITQKVWFLGDKQDSFAVERIKADILPKMNNLKRLGLVINNNLGTKLNLESLAYLKDFYFEARYPGDEFISVTKEMRDRCEEIMEDVLQILSPFAGAYKVDMR